MLFGVVCFVGIVVVDCRCLRLSFDVRVVVGGCGGVCWCLLSIVACCV